MIRVALGVGLIVLIALGIYSYQATSVVVSVYDDHFEPELSVIKVGQRVTFVSQTDRPVWPASDSHPSHGIYPAFDPEAPIAPGESWSFTFDDPGSWKFHDHLRSSLRGEIRVEGDFGSAAYECVSQTDGTARAVCWEEDFKELIAAEGMEPAFNQFLELYEQDNSFRSYCHDIMHYVGRAAYDVYTLDRQIIERPETSFCGYGFYHGFIEASIEQDGSHDLQVAKEYCEEMFRRDEFSDKPEASGPAGACWHGIGHAVFDSLDGSLWGDPIRMTHAALAVCERVFSHEYKHWQCGTGVFNSLANAMANSRYSLVLSPERTVEICESQPELHKDACYLDMAVVHNNSNKLSLAEGIAHTLTFPATSSVAYSIFGVVDDTFRRERDAQPDISEFVTTCEQFAVVSYREACIRGLVIGVSYSSHLDNMANRLASVCSQFSATDNANHCAYRAMLQLRTTHGSSELDQLCRDYSAFSAHCPFKEI